MIKRIFSLSLVLLVTTFGWASGESLGYTRNQSKTVIELLETLGDKHYRKLELDDSVSEHLLDTYVDALDPTKSYFLASDIQYFSQWRITLDDSLKRGDLSQGFEIFQVYRTRVEDRLQANIEVLESDFKFDYDRNENLPIDPDAYSWSETGAQLDDLWRKRMKDSLLRLTLSGKEPKAARELLVKRYRNQLKQLQQRDAEDVFQLYVNALTGLYDPHTNYLSPRVLDNFNINMSLSLEGIGAVLQTEDEHTKVVRVVPGGPADKQQAVMPEDRIIGVGQGKTGEIEDVIGWRLDDVVKLIRGPKNSVVRLQIIPAKAQDTTKVVSIIRDKVKLEEQAAKSSVITIDRGDYAYRIGVIDIPAFYLDFEAYRNRDPDYKSTTRDVSKLLEELESQQVDGIVLDLRDNGGGSLHEATTLTDLFIDPGPVVQIRHANHSISRHHRSRGTAQYSGPLVVLINRLSASASEIFAGAIQDYGRGLVVGTRSFGKGTVQVMVPLPEGQLKLTESKFYRVSGDSTQHRGVVPDIEFPSYYDLNEIGESSQDYALPWDQIHAVSYKRQGEFSGLLPTLTRYHQQRQQTDPDLVYLRGELELLAERREQKEIPLSKSARKREQEGYEQLMLGLENQRRITKGITPYDTVADWKAASGLQDVDGELATDELSSNPAGEDTEEKRDPLLRESAQILVDYINYDGEQPPRLVQNKE